MKILLLIFLTTLSIAAFSQGTQINGNQIKNESIGPEKFTPDALISASSGVLASGELTFDAPQKEYTKTITSNLPLTLAASGNVSRYHIYIIATGDGTHTVTWPVNWRIEGSYDVNAI